MEHEYKRFWLRLALFTAPFAVALLLLTAGLVYMGESMPLVWVAAIQRDNPAVLYRPRFAPRDLPFKITSANARQAEIIALGSSRILQFRAGFFSRQPDAFYNAAAPGWTLDEVIEVFDALDPPPRVLLLAIDPPWFNADYHAPVIPPPDDDFSALFAVNAAFLKDLLNGVPFDRPGWSLDNYRSRQSQGVPALGLRAIRDGHGFRGDGSEQYGDFLVAGWLDMTAARETHHVWLRERREMYIPGESVDAAALAALNGLLGRARDRGVTVIGFLPSYMPSLWDAMHADARFGYVRALQGVLPTLFAEQGFAFYDFSDGAALDTPDADFFDGWHAGERGNARLLAAMAAAQPDVLGAYVDPAALRSMADAAPDAWRVTG